MPKYSDEPVSLVQAVVNKLTKGIQEGRFVPGQRLVASDIAQEFEVSRSPVREAFHILAGQGIIELMPNRGARVRHLKATDIVHFVELTEAILSLGVRLATSKMHIKENQEKVMREIAEINHQYEQRNGPLYIKSLYEYHVALHEISGNSFVDHLYKQSHFAGFNRLLGEKVPGNHWGQFQENYKRIINAVFSGNTYAAQLATASHFQWVISIVKEDYKDELEDQ